jgi:hypothetical protein
MDVHQIDDTGADGLIRLTLPRGTLVVLTPQEFARALKRGKGERRQAVHAHRVQQTHARDEAQRLNWIATEDRHAAP